MADHTPLSAEPQMMRANRKVIEIVCSICQRGFQLAEAVYHCPFCDGFHHAACWESQRQCPSQAVASETTQTASLAESVALASVPPPIVDTPAENLASSPADPAAAFNLQKSALMADEQHCPDCSKVIKREALKCRFCGYVLHRDLVGVIPSHISAKIEEHASKALKYSLIGLICIGIVLEPMAIYNGVKAFELMRQYPDYVSPNSARGKAISGIVIGSISLLLFFSGVLSKALSN